jgi:hypothetical protein
MKQIDFKSDVMKDYTLSMQDNFYLFRMFLVDEVDAIITHFIANKTMSVADMHKVEVGLSLAIQKLALMYPNKMPKSSKAKAKIPKNLNYTNEDLNYNIVLNLTHLLIHLQAVTAATLSFIE